MTILPKKHKPTSSTANGNGNTSNSSSNCAANKEHIEVNEQASESNDLQIIDTKQINVYGSSSGTIGWGGNLFCSKKLVNSSKVWSTPSVQESPNSRWISSNSTSSSGEKRSSTSSLAVYEFKSECSPTASKRLHRTNSAVTVSCSNSHKAIASGSKRNKSLLGRRLDNSLNPPLPLSSNKIELETTDGYNSEDEYSHFGITLTDLEWDEKDKKFDKMMRKKGFLIKQMIDDGSCLFRAIADQVYGDQEMHKVVRSHCMDYVEQNSDYFSQYITEEIETYVNRKRFDGVHGNHLEIQAMSEIYNRPIHIYCYSLEPINIFQNINMSEKANAPLRLSYHRLVHYNSLVDPYKATVGIGLGLPDYSPGSADHNLLRQAVKASEETLVEQVMLEDKIKTTDWEATNEAIEEQVARESYLQWLKDNDRRNIKDKVKNSSSSSTVTSGELRTALSASDGTNGSPIPCSNKLNSSQAECSSDRDSPKPCSSHQKSPHLNMAKSKETESFFTGLQSTFYGLNDWTDTNMLAQVMVASQQEYFDSLKKRQSTKQSK